MQLPWSDEQQLELQALHAQLREKEFALRQAQEKVNDFHRDWLYTTCRNFRGTIARFKRSKSQIQNGLRIAGKLSLFALGTLFAPLSLALRVLGISRRALVETAPEQS